MEERVELSEYQMGLIIIDSLVIADYCIIARCLAILSVNICPMWSLTINISILS